MTESTPKMNGTAAAPQTVNDMVREALRGFNAWMEKERRKPDVNASWLALMEATVPGFQRWRIAAHNDDVPMQDRHNAMVTWLAWMMSNELLRENLTWDDQLAFLAATTGEAAIRAGFMIRNRQEKAAKDALAAAGIPQPTHPEGGNA